MYWRGCFIDHLHSEAPSDSVVAPSGQSVHEAEAGLAANEPCGQFVHSVFPVPSAKVPASHSVHVDPSPE